METCIGEGRTHGRLVRGIGALTDGQLCLIVDVQL